MAEPKVVHIEVLGQTYPIRTSLDPGYVGDLAAFVEQRMQAASDSAPSSDAVALAVLAALNIADEYFRSRSALESDHDKLASRAQELERMVDQALSLAE